MASEDVTAIVAGEECADIFEETFIPIFIGEDSLIGDGLGLVLRVPFATNASGLAVQRVI